jgi:hypothetical protein
MGQIAGLRQHDQIEGIHAEVLLCLRRVPIKRKVTGWAVKENVSLIQSAVTDLGVPGIIVRHLILPPAELAAQLETSDRVER